MVALTPTTLTSTAGDPVGAVPVVRVTDPSGRPVEGAAVTFEVTAGKGSVTGASTRSDAEGAARPGAWTLGPMAAQTNVVRARLSADSAIWVAFTATATAGQIAYLVATGGDGQTGFLGSALANPLSVRGTDRFGNAVAGAAVVFSVIDGGGMLDAARRTTDDAGVATSGSWTLGPETLTQRAGAIAGTAGVVFRAYGVARCAGDCLPGQLAFVRDGDIYTVNADGTGLARLTATGENSEPAWSPDGRRIAFVTSAVPNGSASAIYVMDANGANARRFAAHALSPAWSPDGRRMAYTAFDTTPPGGTHIVIASSDSDGTAPRQVASYWGYNRWAAWSPDGTRLAFASNYAGPDEAFEMYVVDVDGTNLTRLTDGLDSEGNELLVAQPAWSPDGREIAFVRCTDWTYYSDCASSSVAVMASNGTGTRVLAAAGGNARPGWSADGRFVAYAHSCADNRCSPSIYFVPAAGGTKKLLIASGHSPAWRP